MEIMTTCLTRSFRLFAGDRKGVTALEYGLLAALIASMLSVAFLKPLEKAYTKMFDKVTENISRR